MAQSIPFLVHATSGGCQFRIRVKPRGSEDRLIGTHGEALKLSVRQAPEKGSANRAVLAFLARVLDVPTGSVVLVSGESSQDKTIRVAGLAPEECRLRIARRLGIAGRP